MPKKHSLIEGLKKFFKILDPQEKKSLFIFAGYGLLLGLLESLNAYMISFFFKFLREEGEGLAVHKVMYTLHISLTSAIIICLVVVIMSYMVKAIFGFLQGIKRALLIEKMSFRLMTTIVNSYATSDIQRYETFSKDSAMKILVTDVRAFVDSGYNSLTQFISEFCIFSSLMIYLLMQGAWAGFITWFFILSASLCISHLLFSRFNHWVSSIEHTEDGFMRKLRYLLDAYPEVSAFGKAKEFANKVRPYFHRLVLLNNKIDIALIFPKNISDLLFNVLFFSIVIYFVIQKQSMSSMLFIIGTHFYVSYRILPNIHNLAASLNQFKSCMPPIDHIYEEVSRVHHTQSLSQEKISFQKEITLKNIHFSHHSSEQETLKNISLTLKKGECIGIFGKNSAGKTTLLHVLAGLLEAKKGEILIDDHELSKVNWQENITYFPTLPVLIDDSLEHNITFGEDNPDHDSISHLIEESHLMPLERRLKYGRKTKVGENGILLSLGEKQCVSMARGFYTGRDVWIFDDATCALDAMTEQDIMKKFYASKQDKTIIMASSRYEPLSGCDRILILEDGQIEKIVSYSDLKKEMEAMTSSFKKN